MHYKIICSYVYTAFPGRKIEKKKTNKTQPMQILPGFKAAFWDVSSVLKYSCEMFP